MARRRKRKITILKSQQSVIQGQERDGSEKTANDYMLVTNEVWTIKNNQRPNITNKMGRPILVSYKGQGFDNNWAETLYLWMQKELCKSWQQTASKDTFRNRGKPMSYNQKRLIRCSENLPVMRPKGWRCAPKVGCNALRISPNSIKKERTD